MRMVRSHISEDYVNHGSHGVCCRRADGLCNHTYDGQGIPQSNPSIRESGAFTNYLT